MNFYTYIWYITKNGQTYPIYVGKGKDDRKIWHLKNSHNKHLTNTLNKYPHFHVWMDADSEQEAMNREIEWIAKFGRKDLGKGPLLNKTDGGEGSSGRIPSDETRAKLSASRKGKTSSVESIAKMVRAKTGRKRSDAQRAKMSAAQTGKTLSKETRAKIAASRKGKTASDETRAKLSAIHTGRVYEHITCPHCSKTGGKNVMKKWHFDNCKFIQ